MVPLTDAPVGKLDGTKVLLLSGRADPIVPAANSRALAAMLADAGPKTTHQELPTGHGLT